MAVGGCALATSFPLFWCLKSRLATPVCFSLYFPSSLTSFCACWVVITDGQDSRTRGAACSPSLSAHPLSPFLNASLLLVLLSHCHSPTAKHQQQQKETRRLMDKTGCSGSQQRYVP
jgi:phosphoribosyl 1,2-cyclic phosphodiesterase